MPLALRRFAPWLLLLLLAALRVDASVAQQPAASAVAQQPAAAAAVPWRNILRQRADWYASDAAVRIADNVLAYQHQNGGWDKNIDMARPLTDEELDDLKTRRSRSRSLPLSSLRPSSLRPSPASSIDNGATHTQIRYLALVHNATAHERFADGPRRGIEFLLAAQYENGGWPMIYPLRRGYYSHITFNDGAMIGAMRVLRDVAARQAPFEFVADSMRDRAQQAIDRGLQVVLKCQIRHDGQLTAWCAQHDAVDFRPRGARAYELPSLSGHESVGITQYLIELDDPSPAVRLAIRSAVAWFDEVKIEGQAIRQVRDPALPRGHDRVMVADPAGRPLWARFYEIGTNRPLFVGRDGVPRHALADIEHERRVGYSYVGEYAAGLLANDYPAWQEKWGDH